MLDSVLFVRTREGVLCTDTGVCYKMASITMFS